MNQVANGNDNKPTYSGRRMASGGVWVLLSRLVVAATQVITLGLLARLLSPGDMGVYFIIANFVIIASTFVQMGIPQVIVKRCAEAFETGGRQEVKAMMQRCLLLATGVAFSCLLIFNFGLGQWLATSVFHSEKMLGVIPFIGLWLVAMALQRSVGEAFRGIHNMRMASIFAGAFSGIVMALAFGAIAFWLGTCTLEQAVWISFGAMALSLLVAFVSLGRSVPIFRPPFSLPSRSLATLALPIFIASLGNIVLTRADIWLLGMYVADDQVALYGAAARVIGLLGTPMLIAVAITAPVIAQLNARGDREQLQRIVQLVPTFLAMPTLVVIGGLVLWGDSLLSLLYGDVFYAGASNILTILAIGQAGSLIAGVSIQVLLMTNQQQAVLRITLVCTLAAIVAALLVVDQHGINGIAVVFAVAIAVQALAAMLVCRMSLGLNTWVWPPLLRRVGAIAALLRNRPARQRRQGSRHIP
ncbi:lipopolysaccharide biosynthesis protein [Teredinibacter waterburyi]|uniref:lipopolysaccharide biosynthesis protein n=1 Tax=Teredinibacter waterburyi TaxID=1500538 RepID=UPI001FE73D16|nr:oligosaccharide flippase family protein [Teredinibacter waterburyi]